MNRKQELEAMIRGLYAELNAIRSDEADAENSALLGRCFRMRNSYSCPESDADRWWFYCRVVAVEDGALKALTFQNDNQGRITVENETHFSALSLADYEEISEAQFLKEWGALLSDVQKCKTAP